MSAAMTTDLLAHLDESIIRTSEIAAGTIFVSYSRKNRDIAKALYAKLERMGFRLWRDVHDIPAGEDDWWQNIQDAIRECETMILCMSMPALRSPVVGDEWAYAREQGKRIIPVVVDDIWDHPDVTSGAFTLPNWMQRRNWIDFRATKPEYEAAWANLIRTLNESYTPKRFISMTPELPPRFVRRVADMDAVIRGLVDDQNDAVAMTTALKGAGGYGKTTLAKAVARDVRIQGAFDDGILWVTLGEQLLKLSPDALQTALIDRASDLIKLLTGSVPVIKTLDAARTELQAAIGDLYLLLVIDDVWDARHLAPFLVKTAHAACLITTRSLETVNRNDILKQTVDKMTPIEAVELLGAGFDAAEVRANDTALRALARDLREYPLVLALANTQIANYAHDMGLPLTDAIQLANETLAEQGVLGFDDASSDDRSRAVSLTLDVSIRQLTPEQQRMYRELAIFPEDALIPLTTLERYWGLTKVATLQFCQTLYRKTALLHSFEGMAIRIHDVFRDCLLRAWTAEELRALHGRLIERWGMGETPHPQPLSKGEGSALLLPDEYAWRNIAYHLLAAGHADRLRELLLDYRWLQAKLDATDVNALVADCEALLGAGADEAIRLVHSALSMSAHILTYDKDALAHQLHGRLYRHNDIPSIAVLRSACADVPGLCAIDNGYDALLPAGGNLLATFSGHEGAIRGAMVLNDGSILSWSADRTLRQWKSDGTKSITFIGHQGIVWGALALSDGSILSWSTDSTLRRWKNDGTTLFTFSGHRDIVWGALVLDDETILSWSKDGTLHRWRSDGAILAIFLGHTESLNGVLPLNDGSILSWSDDNTLRRWGRDGAPLAIFRGHKDRVWGALVLDDGNILSWSEDETLRCWDVSGTELIVFKGHIRRVNGVMILSDGSILSWSDDNTLLRWRRDGVILATFNGHMQSVNGALALDDGSILSWSDDNRLRRWSQDGSLIAIFNVHDDIVRGAMELNHKSILSWSQDGTLRRWRYDGAIETVYAGHTWDVTGALMLENGDVISWSQDGTLRRWKHGGVTGEILTAHTKDVWGTLASDDGIVVSWSQDGRLRIWGHEGASLVSFSGHKSSVNGARLLDDSSVLSWSNDGTLQRWQRNGSVLATFTGHTWDVNGVLVVEDGGIVSWSRDGTLRRWRSDGTCVAILRGHTYWLNGALVLNDGSLLSWSVDKTLRRWTLDGTLLATFSGHEGTVEGALELSDGNLLSWSHDGTLRRWDSNGKMLAVFNEYGEVIVGALELKDGRILSWSLEGAIRLWSNDGRAQSVISEPYYVGDKEIIFTWACEQGFDGNLLYPESEEPYIKGKRIAFKNNIVYVYDPSSGITLTRFIGDAGIRCLAVLSDDVIAAGDSVGRVLFLRWRGA